MIREFSAGGVVVRKMQGRWWLALIEPEGRSKRTQEGDEKTIWALPKGLVDRGESAEQAAEREVHEETGIEADLITKLGDTKYFYIRSWGDGERVFKIVSFFLFRYRSGRIGDISEEMKVEVRRAEWAPLEEGERQLAYRTERKIIAQTVQYIQSHPEL